MNRKLSSLIFGLYVAVGQQYAVAQSVSYNALSHKNISQITVNGSPLLTGCGFYLVGSADNVDGPNNITSCDFANATVRTYPNSGVIDGSTQGTFLSPVGLTTPWLAHQLHFTPDSYNSTRMLFGGQIGGPSYYNFATVSLPFDADRNAVTHYRYNGSQITPFSGFPYAYTVSGLGNVYINHIGTGISWGELIGPDYTMRVTITGTSPDPNTNQPRALRLYFVDHPATKNVEFSFDPSVANAPHIQVGEKVNFTGHVEIYDTDPSIYGYTTFETESSGTHQSGRADQDGWSVNVYQDSAPSFMNYGPYTPYIPAGSHTGVWRILTDDVTASNANLVYIDVYDVTTSTVIAARDLYRSEFKVANKYQNFNLAFTSEANHTLEFRTVWRGGSYIRQDKVVIK